MKIYFRFAFSICTIITVLNDKISAQDNIDYLLNKDIYLPFENGDSAFVADPHVIKVDDEWFLYGTTFSTVGLEAWSTKDLIQWKWEGYVWKPTPGSWNTRDLWAPEVIQAEDGFYMYYSASGKIGVAFSKTPGGPFLDVYDHPFIGGGYGGVGNGKYIGNGNVNSVFTSLFDFREYAIDAHILKASNGTLWIYFAKQKPSGAIAVLPLKDYVTLAADKPKIVLRPKLFSWEKLVREGAFIVEHDGIFHLMYSGSFWFTNRYAMGVATSASPLGSFKRRKDNPLLHKSEVFNLAGPGHHSIVEGKYNDWLIFYHTRRWGEKPSAPRRTRYMQMSFDGNGQIQVNKVKP